MCPKTVEEYSRITKCLSATRESRTIEFKESFNPNDSGQSLEVLKDLVAIANSGGGTLVIGIDNLGNCSDSDVKPVLSYDHAKYCDLIKKYTSQHFSDFEIVERKRDGHAVAIFVINPPDSPLVFEKPGTYDSGGKHPERVFSQGTTYFRHGAKSETGTTDDLRRFLEKRVREMNEELFKGVRKISVSPRGARLEVAERGSLGTGPDGAVPVRITNNPDARGAFAVNVDQMFHYRRKDLVAKLKEALSPAEMPTTFDLQAIGKVHKVTENKNFCWKPQFSSPQYSEAYIEWLIEMLSYDKLFLQDARDKYHEMTSKKDRV